jgi:hypothetical protein
METRKNAGYVITNAIKIGESEVVLGIHEKNPNMCVTWECSNGDNYHWGHYFDNLLSAQKDFCKRGYDKARLVQHLNKSNKSEPER